MSKVSTALVLYMPVIHKSYLEFIAKNPTDVIVLIDNSMALELVPELRKDLRALDANVIKSFLSRQDGAPRVIVDNNYAINVAFKIDQIIMPNEDICHEFQKKYIADKKVEFKNVFLRYDKKKTLEEVEPNPDEIVTNSQFAQAMIALCDELAEKSPDWWRQIGGLIVIDGKVIDELQLFNQSHPVGMNPYHVGDPRSNFKKGLNAEFTTVLHVEQGLVSLAARKGLALEGADLYVSTFPCPWCSKAVAAAGVARVFYRDGYAMLDGEEILKVNDVQIIRVVDENET